jgi:succinate-semialdehyde dehydrogenase / glutarate-semialdehyde dehydrogenase
VHDLLDALPSGLLVGGTWRTTASTFDVRDPATGSLLASVVDAEPADGLAALDAAAAAGPAWAAVPPRRRAEILRGAFDRLMSRADEFAQLITLEMGKPLAESRAEVGYGGEFLRWFSEEAVRIGGRYAPTPEGHGRMIVSQRPVGPSYLITPWNFPLAMATRKIAPALAAGCTVIIKPSELTPLTTLRLAEILCDAGVPDGVLNVTTTTRPAPLTDALLADPRLRKLSFTGSTAVGRLLLRSAADRVLRTSMELGGNAPFIVFEDADLDRAVEGAMAAKFRNVGQACTAANRFLVHADVAAEFAERLSDRVRQLVVGAGSDPGVTVGPLINEAAVEKARRLVADAVERGARLRVGGGSVDGPGTFFVPTVLTEVPAGAAILDEEIFGPVVAMSTFRTEDEAVSVANDTDYGLVSYVFTQDLARAQRLVDTLDTGMMGLNVGVVSNAAAPFGGVKQSGIGREGGAEGIHEYLETKYTLTADPWPA